MQLLITWLANAFQKGINDWKTTLVGIAILAVAILYGRGILNDNELMLAGTVLTGIGFALSRDSQKKKPDSSVNESGS